MRRRPPLFRAVLLGLAVVTASGCDALFGTYCDEDANCPSNQVCSTGICVVGDRAEDAGVEDAGIEDAGVEDAGVEDAGAEDAGVEDAGVDDAGVEDAGVEDAGVDDAGIDAGVDDAGVDDAGVEDAGVEDAGVDAGLLMIITGVDGTGTTAPVSAVPTLDGGVLAGHRVRDTLVVTGEGFESVDFATLESDVGEPILLDIVPLGQSDGEVTLMLPNTVSTGLMTLTLTASTLSTSASAQVFVVQGEAAAPTISTSVNAPGACPGGEDGTNLTVGPDNGSGSPDGTPILICNGVKGDPGDPGSVSCTGGNCTVDANLNVTGALTVDGDDVQRVISEDETISVADLSQLTTALEDLQNFRIAPDATVTIQLGPATYLPTTPIAVNHPDSDRIEIIGNISTPSTVEFRCANSTACFSAVDSTLRLNGVAISGVSTQGGIGISAGRGGVVVLGSSTPMESLDRAVFVVDGGAVFATSLDITNSVSGLFIENTGYIHSPFAGFSGVRFAVLATGGTVDISGSQMTALALAGTRGISASLGAVVFADGTTATSFNFPFRASEGGFIQLNDANIIGGDVGIEASQMSIVIADRVSVTGASVGIRATSIGLVQASSPSFSTNGTDTEADGTSLIE